SETRPALSPSRARVVSAARDGVLLVLDTATGRVVRTYGKWAKGGEQLYWLGGEGTKSDPEVLVARLGVGPRYGGQAFNIIDRRDPGSRAVEFGGYPTT